MAQEQFAGPEYHTEFDPEKFLRDLKIQNSEESETSHGKEATGEEADQERS